MTKKRRANPWLIPLVMVVAIVAIIWIGIGHLSKEMIRSELPDLPEMQRRTRAVQQQMAEADAGARSKPRSGEAVGGLAIRCTDGDRS